MPEEAIRTALEGLPMEVVPFDEEQAFQAGVLRASTKGMGLSIGDRGCLSLAERLGVPALTTDRAWELLSLSAKVRMTR
jgi:PIN domain nuclease of toxin-antitoxin system